MEPDGVKRVIYGLTIAFIGFLGLAIIVVLFLAMAGISTPISRFYAFSYLGAELSGPLMLFAGGALIALNVNRRIAAGIAFAGAIVITIWAAGIIGSAILDALHPSANPAIDSTIHLPDLMVYAILAIVAGMVDWAAYRALRLCR